MVLICVICASTVHVMSDGFIVPRTERALLYQNEFWLLRDGSLSLLGDLVDSKTGCGLDFLSCQMMGVSIPDLIVGLPSTSSDLHCHSWCWCHLGYCRPCSPTIQRDEVADEAIVDSRYHRLTGIRR